MERICDHIGLLHQGKLALQGSMDEIRRLRRSDGFEVDFIRQRDAETFSRVYSGGMSAGSTQLVYDGRNEEDMANAMKLLCENHIYPLKIEMREPTLESLFMEVVGK